MCALSKLIGHSENSFHNYEVLGSVWNIKKTHAQQKKEKRNLEPKKVIDLDENNLHLNFDAMSKSDKGGSMPELQEDDPLEIKSIKSELSHKGKDIFAD